MAKKKPARKPVDDPALLRTGLAGFGELTILIRQLANESGACAIEGEPDAYRDLQHLLREVRTLIDSGQSALVADLSNSTAEKLSENCRIALNLGDYRDLHGQCGTCITKIQAWQPAPRVRFKRARLIIGTDEEYCEQRDLLGREFHNDPDRVADREGQHAIRLAVESVLKTLGTMSSVLRKRLVGRGSGGQSKVKSWTQSELDEAIKKYREDHMTELQAIKNAIAEGQPNAIDESQKLFGRNSIAKILQVRAPAMVSKSPEWQSLADELGIPNGPGCSRRQFPSKRDPSDEMYEELLEKARENLSAQEVTDILQQVEEGKMSPDDAVTRINRSKKRS